MKKKFLVLIMISMAGFTQAQDIGSIFTDRPSQTDAVALLPKNVFQIESGYFWSNDEVLGNATTSMNIPNLMLKYGLLPWLELRAGTALLYRKQENISILTTNTELGGIFIAPKLKILEPKGLIPRISATAYLTLPGTGTGFAKDNNGALNTRLLLENPLSDNLSLAYSIGTDSDFSGNTNGFYSIMLSASFGRLGAFTEFFSNVINGGPNAVGLDGGVGFTLTDNFTIDLAIGLGLNTYATDIFLNSGIGYRIH